MDVAEGSLFLSHSDPMWIYDPETLRFLVVNTAAIARYGYTREEFLAMTIADIRPAEDVSALKKHVAGSRDGWNEAGIWRHCLKSGGEIYVDIKRLSVDHDGRPASLITAQDVSSLVSAELSAREALAAEKAARQSSDALARQFKIMFDSVPGKFLVFSPERFDVVAVSACYLAATGTARADIVGRNLFDTLPRQPRDPNHAKLRESFDRVTATGTPDLLDVEGFLLPRKDGADGVEERFWAVATSAVKGPDGRLLHLMLRMQDVTEAVTRSADGSAEFTNPRLPRDEFDLIAHTNALKTDNLRLTELATRLRTTQHLLGTGTWDYVIAEDRLLWSSTVYDMYGMTPHSFGLSLQEYAEMVHPDDRATMRADFEAFIASDEKNYTLMHQVVRPDGRIIHVNGVGEKVETERGTVVSGAVQDVTEQVKSLHALAQTKRLLELAGTAGQFGAWRYDVQSEWLEWSHQTARIHDEPEGFAPSVAQAIAYFTPEDRDRMAGLFKSCLDHGEPFSEVFEIISAKGRRLSVRKTGEAERDATGRIIAVYGAFQDVTELVTVRQRAEESEKLLEIAGRALKLGGWRVSLVDRAVSWTDGVALIHELPPGYRPTFDVGLNFFAPEERECARQVFEACATAGTPFDNVRAVITAKGNRIKVRSFGEPVRNRDGVIIAVQGAMQDVSDLTAAQQDASDLNTRLAETLENIGDAFFTLDHDWRFTYLNGRAKNLLGQQRNGLIGRKIFDEFPEAVGTAYETEYNRVFETGQTVRFEQFFPPLKRTFRVHAHLAPGGLAVYFTDITEERRRDEKLRLLGAAVERLNDLVVITEAEDIDGPDGPRIVYVNEAFERRTGFTREQVIGKTPRILQGRNTQRAELDRIRTALEQRMPVRAEVINYAKNGDEYCLEIDIVPIADETGAYTHYVAVQRDITERRRAEEALRVSEARFRLIAKATGHAVWEWDIASGWDWWSDALSTIFGHTPDPEGTLATVWRGHLHPDDISRVDEEMNSLVLGTTETMNTTYRFQRADGSWATVEDRAFAIRDAEGRATRILGSITDVSERLHMEDRLRQSQKLEAVGQLTGGVAHDFNNLLTIIIGNIELLQEGLEEGHPLRRHAEMGANAADRAAELTNRLLVFSRKQALQPKVTDVNAVIGGIEGMLSRTLGEDIDIRIVRADEVWRTEVDPGQLESALLNLAINSRDAMPDGGRLTIETANAWLDEAYVSTEPSLKAGHYVVITVSDTGHGIPHDQIDRVFEPFFTTKDVGKGTGLGLSMVYGFVTQTSGLVTIYSEPGEGTRVNLYFPRFDDQQMVALPEPDRTQPVRGQETILVVEDDQMILQQLVIQLEGLGYAVVTAPFGAPALAILRDRADIDLLFTDVVLPGGMNGRQIAAAAQAIRPGLKVLYTSGYSEHAIVHHGRLDPGVELLSKPYRRSELASKIRKVLGS